MTPTPASPRRIRCVSPRATESGDVAPYFVEWIRQLLDQQFGQQTLRAGPQGLHDARPRPAVGGRARAGAAARAPSSPANTARTGTRPTSSTSPPRAAARSGTPRRRRTSRARSSRWIRAPAPCARMVGGRDFDDSKFNRAVQALRQPGSTFKPVVYAAAIQNGRPPTYVLDDSPLTLAMAVGDTWNPQNYDGEFEGQIPLRKALYESRNVPDDPPRHGARRADRDRHGVASSASRRAIPAYPVDPHRRRRRLSRSRWSPRTPRSRRSACRPAPWGSRASRTPTGRGALDAGTDSRPCAVARGSVAHGGHDEGRGAARHGGGRRWARSSRFPSGGKTGTTNDYTDVWYIGFTGDLVAGVWIGLDKPERIMSNAQGGRLAAPAWTAFMTEVYRRKPPPPDWPRPARHHSKKRGPPHQHRLGTGLPRHRGDRVLHRRHASRRFRAT